MKILAIETSSSGGRVALLDGDRVLGEKALESGAQHARSLVACADELMQQAGMLALPRGDASGVELIAVSAGPGSYTGLRVGVTFAKTLAVETGAAVVSVSSLDVIAANFTEAAGLCVVTDARLGQVYAAVYDGEKRKVLDDTVAPAGEIAARLDAGTTVIGDGLRRYRAAFEAAKVVSDETLWWPRAVNVGRLGHARFLEQGGEDPRALAPRYLRRPQAEVTWQGSRIASGRR